LEKIATLQAEGTLNLFKLQKKGDNQLLAAAIIATLLGFPELAVQFAIMMTDSLCTAVKNSGTVCVAADDELVCQKAESILQALAENPNLMLTFWHTVLQTLLNHSFSQKEPIH